MKCDEIIDRLFKQYHISANRKTIYDDIAVLTCFVNVKHWRHGGYWVEKDGENSESNEAIGFYDECCCEGLKYLEKPPQSWRYVDYPEKEM